MKTLIQKEDKMDNRTIAERLVDVRKAKGFNKKFVSAQTGIPYPTLCGYEYGRNEPPITTIVKLAELYGVTSEYIMKGEEKKESSAPVDTKTEDSVTMKALIHFCDMAGFLRDGQADISDSDLLFLKSIISACAEWFGDKDITN